MDAALLWQQCTGEANPYPRAARSGGLRLKELGTPVAHGSSSIEETSIEVVEQQRGGTMKHGYMMGMGLATVLGLPSFASAEGTKKEPGQHEQQQQTQRVEQSSTGFAAMGADDIKQVQRHLQQHGFYDGNIDGIVGPKTRTALTQFQQQQGLPATGAWNSETANALGLDVMQSERQPVRGTDSSMEARGSELQQEPGVRGEPTGMTSISLAHLNEEQTRSIQERLRELGHYRGEIDGKVGPQTRAALRGFFQQQVRLAERGIVSDAAVELFGLDVSEVQPVSGVEEQQETQD